MTIAAVYHCPRAWLCESGATAAPTENLLRLRDNVLIEVDGAGTIAGVTADVACPPTAVRLPGVVVPGFANAHSHAFHRALRGRTHDTGGTFWTWRERMYAVADQLNPDSYLALATAVYAEMALSGVTCVGEFHYLHHAPGGRRYDDANVMGEALREAARRAGIRLTLLDACYLVGGFGAELSPSQRRFSDDTAAQWAARVADVRSDSTTRLGVAAHSVRAVPPHALDVVAEVARAGDGMPLHAHVSEQPAENTACLEAHGVTPTQLLHDHGALTPMTTAVHATHVSRADLLLLGGARAFVCCCPTTERDLADGIGPASALRAAGARLTLGTDQHAVVDLLEEARALEMDERLQSLERVRLAPQSLLWALSSDGHASLGWPEAGRLEVGAPADLVAVRTDSVRTAGAAPAQVLMAATASDVDTVVVGGRPVVVGGGHALGDVAELLAEAIAPLWQGVASRQGA